MGSGGAWGGAMKRQEDAEKEAQVDEIVEMLMHEPLPKADRIRLMKELVRKGDKLSDEILAEALKRLMERILDHP